MKNSSPTGPRVPVPEQASIVSLLGSRRGFHRRGVAHPANCTDVAPAIRMSSANWPLPSTTDGSRRKQMLMLPVTGMKQRDVGTKPVGTSMRASVARTSALSAGRIGPQ